MYQLIVLLPLVASIVAGLFRRQLGARPTELLTTSLVGISALLGAVGGILVCDYWLVRRARLSLLDLYRRDGRYSYDRGINFSALLAGAIAVACCVPGFVDQATHGTVLSADHTAGFVFKQLYNYGVFVTFGVAFVAYAVLMGGHPNVRMAVEPGPLLAVPDPVETNAVIPEPEEPVAYRRRDGNAIPLEPTATEPL